mgnify:CR=1 FL=1
MTDSVEILSNTFNERLQKANMKEFLKKYKHIDQFKNIQLNKYNKITENRNKFKKILLDLNISKPIVNLIITNFININKFIALLKKKYEKNMELNKILNICEYHIINIKFKKLLKLFENLKKYGEYTQTFEFYNNLSNKNIFSIDDINKASIVQLILIGFSINDSMLIKDYIK